MSYVFCQNVFSRNNLSVLSAVKSYIICFRVTSHYFHYLRLNKFVLVYVTCLLFCQHGISFIMLIINKSSPYVFLSLWSLFLQFYVLSLVSSWSKKISLVIYIMSCLFWSRSLVILLVSYTQKCCLLSAINLNFVLS